MSACDRLPDFEAYLSFVEESVQHLQFAVWYQSYRERFFALPAAMQALSPAYVSSDHPYPPSMSNTRSGSDFLTTKDSTDVRSTYLSMEGSTLDGQYAQSGFVSGKAASNAPASLSPFGSAPTISHTKQPFRPEIARIVATFLAPNAIKPLRLSEGLHNDIVCRLASTTHPDVLAPAYDFAMITLRDALPRFLAQSVVVINRPKQVFWFRVAPLWISLGLLVFLATLFGSAHGPAQHLSDGGLRGLRLLALPFIFYGSAMAIMSATGSCARVMKRGHMQLRPWELDAPSDDAQTWWEGITGVPSKIADEEDRLPGGLAEVEEGTTNRYQGGVETIAVPLALRARRKALQARARLLADLSSLELPSFLKPTSAASPTMSPVMISFTRMTSVVADDTEHPVNQTASMPPAFMLNLDSEQAAASGDPKQAFSSDDHVLGDEISTSQYDKILSLSPPRLPRRFSLPSKRTPAVFGPEKVVLDPRILAAHRRIQLFILSYALCPTLVSGFLWQLSAIDRLTSHAPDFRCHDSHCSGPAVAVILVPPGVKHCGALASRFFVINMYTIEMAFVLILLIGWLEKAYISS
jgi:hypothetical protein